MSGIWHLFIDMEKIKDIVLQWIAFGANYQTGVQIYFQLVGEGDLSKNLFKRETTSSRDLLIRSLKFRASIPIEKNSPTKIRDDFPYLHEQDTPNELKILVSNKITCYHNYREAHAKLFDCTSMEEEFFVVKNLVENYIENYKIHQELHYYKKHKVVLGNHPIFKDIKRLKDLRQTSPVELFKKKKNIEHNIWRIQKLIVEAKKPHLDFERKAKIAQYEIELQEIKNILKE